MHCLFKEYTQAVTITMQDAEFKWINVTNLKSRLRNGVCKMIHIYYFHLGLKSAWLLTKSHCLTTLWHVQWNAARPNYHTAFTGFKGGQFWIHWLACSIFRDENTAILYPSFHRGYIILGTNRQGRWTYKSRNLVCSLYRDETEIKLQTYGSQ